MLILPIDPLGARIGKTKEIGNVDIVLNDPAAIRVMNSVLSGHIQRGIGDKDKETGKTIQAKELAHIGLTEDGKGVIPSLKVTYSDGSTAFKPMTRFGSTDPNDTITPIALPRLMEEFRGYSQVVGQLNYGDRAKFLNDMVNPTSKQESAEAKEHRTQKISSKKARANAIAKDPNNAAAINAQFDLLDEQIDGAYGKAHKPDNDGVSAQLDQWAVGDPGKVAFVKQVAATYAPGNNVSKAHLDAKYAEATRGQSNEQNSQVAHLLRVRGKTAPTHPPYYTGNR
ncbi:hypothetical protein [Candidatus Symbiopectobacterium sp. NZEC151]|uniref:hypothetical protein n=1 Tax=Candidatus Symbiopectobacterium sp. NZEC151 TaxID=2820470 RepID=UPI00222702B7|nr:hypothetical protein [Candidatus Symbiopectobacterium sp. NZEC151]MCW2473659.1 hypothetical protein [Candidatus Symbiopectobacterium sp. NZEC151]